MGSGVDQLVAELAASDDARREARQAAEVKRAAKYITKANGGNGAVREVCDKIIRAHGKWNVIIERLKQAEGYRDR